MEEINKQKDVLSVLLENCKLCYEAYKTNSNFLTLDQLMWLTEQGWLRSELKNLVSIQPMLQPTALVFYRKDGTKLEYTGVAAKTAKFNFSLFNNVDFDSMKEMYANAIAAEIDYNIFMRMPGTDCESIMCAAQNCKLGFIYDYIVAPQNYIDTLRNIDTFKSVDFYVAPIVLDRGGCNIKVTAGKYPSESQMDMPIFMPYILVNEYGYINRFARIAMRFGWFDEEVEEIKNTSNLV